MAGVVRLRVGVKFVGNGEHRRLGGATSVVLTRDAWPHRRDADATHILDADPRSIEWFEQMDPHPFFPT